MANDRGMTLAARLRAGIEAKAEEREEASRNEKSRNRTLAAQRDRLFKDLFEFGQAIGHIRITAAEGLLRFQFERAELRFEAEGAGDLVCVSGGEIPDRTELFVQPELNLWVVRTHHSLRKETQDLLFDAGLEQLLRLGLGI